MDLAIKLDRGLEDSELKLFSVIGTVNESSEFGMINGVNKSIITFH